MKRKVIIALVYFVMMGFVSGCKKEAGPGGKNSISGTIFFKNGLTGSNDVAPMATISVAYGTNEATTSFDQTIVADASGNYTIEGLNKGNYFIKAGYADGHGFSYSTQGVGIILKNKKNKTEVNIVLE